MNVNNRIHPADAAGIAGAGKHEFPDAEQVSGHIGIFLARSPSGHEAAEAAAQQQHFASLFAEHP